MKNLMKIKPGTVYICGPITGLPNNNYEAFARVQEQLDALGIPNVNPHEIFEGIDTSEFTHDDYMKHCIAHLAFCDRIVTLSKWFDSKGAKMEVNIARELGKTVVIAEEFIKKQKQLHNNVN